MDIEKDCQAATERAIQAAHRHPPDHGPPNRLMFFFAQWLWGVPSVAELPADALEPYVLAFWHGCRGIDPYHHDEEAAVSQFNNIWDHQKVKRPRDYFLKEAARGARKGPIRSELEHLRPRAQALGMFCYHLARMNRYGWRFFLSQDDAAAFLGVHQTTAGDILYALCRAGIIRRIRKGTNANGLASVYRYEKPGDKRRAVKP